MKWYIWHNTRSIANQYFIKIQSGGFIGGFVETSAFFLDLVERVKSDFAEAK